MSRSPHNWHPSSRISRSLRLYSSYSFSLFASVLSIFLRRFFAYHSLFFRRLHSLHIVCKRSFFDLLAAKSARFLFLRHWQHFLSMPPVVGNLVVKDSPGSQPGPATALGSATALRPGIEPGIRTSQTRVMSVSPSKRTYQYPGQDSNLDLDLRRIVCFPLHHQGKSSSGGWGRTSTSGFRVRRPTVRRPRNGSVPSSTTCGSRTRLACVRDRRPHPKSNVAFMPPGQQKRPGVA